MFTEQDNHQLTKAVSLAARRGLYVSVSIHADNADDPAHTGALEAILKAMPDAEFIERNRYSVATSITGAPYATVSTRDGRVTVFTGTDLNGERVR